MMKTLRTFVTLLFLGAFMALVVERFAGAPASATTPDSRTLALLTLAGPASCPGDLNGDDQVNSADLSVLLANFGNNCLTDADNDGFGSDQDCDDNDPAVFPGSTQACPTGFPGVCSTGTRTCQIDATWTACTPGILPNSQPETCNTLDDDCDGSIDEGGAGCATAPNAITACVGGNCTIVSCTPGFANCDGNPINGCETNTNTSVNNCGACGLVCNLPNAIETCVGGSCAISSCNPGFSNCNGSTADGCETNHAFFANTCGSATFLGAACGDGNCPSPFCSSSGPASFASASGNTSRWYRARVTECSTCLSSLSHSIRLNVPAGIDYDLFVYSSCGGTLLGSSTNGAGALDIVNITRSDTAADDSFDYYIEIRYQSGASCTNWGLTLIGTNC